jgi:hypothetical protein
VTSVGRNPPRAAKPYFSCTKLFFFSPLEPVLVVDEAMGFGLGLESSDSSSEGKGVTRPMSVVRAAMVEESSWPTMSLKLRLSPAAEVSLAESEGEGNGMMGDSSLEPACNDRQPLDDDITTFCSPLVLVLVVELLASVGLVLRSLG